MKKRDFNCSIAVNMSTSAAFAAILQVSKWWTKDFKGDSARINDEFIIQHGTVHFSRHKLFEIIPGKKLVWLITESSLNWLQGNRQEWTNTKMIFDLKSRANYTVIYFTHQGLVPELECYFRCIEGWEMVIRERLYLFLTLGTDQSA